MRKRIAIYTAVAGNYETELKEHPDIEGVDWIAFSDEPQLNIGWKIRSLQYHHESPRMSAKWHKVFPHLCLPEYTRTIWIDGSVTVKDPQLASYVHYAHPIATFIHPERGDILDEAFVSARMPKYFGWAVASQATFYRHLGLPMPSGLWACGIIARRDTDSMRQLMSSWWAEIETWSPQDQISFPYVCWRHLITPYALPGCLYHNAWFDLAMQPDAL